MKFKGVIASRSGKSKCVVKLLEKVVVEARLFSRIPHLEGETIFSNAKQKLDLLPRDDRNSHCHNRVNFSIPMVGRDLSPALQGELN